MSNNSSNSRRSVGFASKPSDESDNASSLPLTSQSRLSSKKTFTMPSEEDYRKSAAAKLNSEAVRKSLLKQFPDFNSDKKTQKKILDRFISDARKKAEKNAAKAAAAGQTVLSSDGTPLSIEAKSQTASDSEWDQVGGQSTSTSLRDIATTPTKSKSRRKKLSAESAASEAAARYERNKQRSKPKVDVFADTVSSETGTNGEVSLGLTLEDLFSIDKPEGKRFSFPGSRPDGKDALTVNVSYTSGSNAATRNTAVKMPRSNTQGSVPTQSLPFTSNQNSLSPFSWTPNAQNNQFRTLGSWGSDGGWTSQIKNTVNDFANSWNNSSQSFSNSQSSPSGWGRSIGSDFDQPSSLLAGSTDPWRRSNTSGWGQQPGQQEISPGFSGGGQQQQPSSWGMRDTSPSIPNFAIRQGSFGGLGNTDPGTFGGVDDSEVPVNSRWAGVRA